MILDIGQELAESDHGAGAPTALPLGQPMSPYIKTWLLDAQGRLSKENEEGLLHFTGPNLFTGYCGLPEVTREKLTETDRVMPESVWPQGMLLRKCGGKEAALARMYNTSDR